jgi:hypothetical protein
MKTVEVPDSLRAGCCIEIWASDYGTEPAEGDSYHVWEHRRSLVAFRRFADARERWLAKVGLTSDDVPEMGNGTAWSFTEMADLAGRGCWLEERGLPPDWMPAPATPENFGPLPGSARRRQR